jgi:hypothetical protein
MLHGTISDWLTIFTEKVIWKKSNGVPRRILVVTGPCNMHSVKMTLHLTGQSGGLNPACYIKSTHKVHYITCLEDIDSSTLSLTLVIDVGGRLTPSPGRFNPGYELAPTVQEDGLDPRTAQRVASRYTDWTNPDWIRSVRQTGHGTIIGRSVRAQQPVCMLQPTEHSPLLP